MNNLIKKFKRSKILVLGDAMIDTYVAGRVQRFCREAPVPIVDVTTQTHVPGGGANAAVNVAALGATTTFLSVIGSDQEGELLLSNLNKRGITIKNIFVDPSRTTLSKKRIIGNGQLTVRYDTGSTYPIQETYEKQIVNTLIDLYTKHDAVIVSDYGYGILTEKIIFTLKQLQQRIPTILVIDAKHLDLYKEIPATAVKPNYQEAISLLGITKIRTSARKEQLLAEREKILQITNAQLTAITLDTEGALLLGRNGLVYQTHTKPVEDARAIGAGDTYTAAFTLSLAIGLDPIQAADISSIATQIILQKEGTAYCTNEELQYALIIESKRIYRKQIKTLIQPYKKKGKRIVFTNGCFDILHSGHIAYLEEAKKLGDILIVGVNTDNSVRRLKGSKRPINTLAERISILSGLKSIDYIIPFFEDTPINLIKLIQPDIFVKGGDYTENKLPEAKIIRKLGGSIYILPYKKDHSTTNVIKKINTVYQTYNKHVSL